ncbi:MAG: hypothetical protein ACI9TH_003182 [Kiritimatiellia bacterium]|jgi:hypothetical protein
MKLCAVLFCLCGLLRAQIVFEDVTDQARLRSPLVGIMGHGAAWGDVDADGDPDLFVGGFADRPDTAYGAAGHPPSNRLLINQGDGTFTVGAMPHLPARTSGAIFSDLDNDGRLELYVANNAKARARPGDPELQAKAKVQRSVLYQNQWPNLKPVQDCAATPDTLLTARNVGVMDYNADGLLDLLVVEDRFTSKPRSALFRNDGALHFSDVTHEQGLPEDLFGLGLAVGDVNGDRRPDFFIGHSNRMLISMPDGRWSEPERLRATFAWEPYHNEDWPCGAAFGDLNNDGWPDLVLGIHGKPARNRIYLHRGLVEGLPTFEMIPLPTWPEKCPHVEIHDFDNDGWPDLYFSSGMLHDGVITPLIYRNLGVKNGVPQFVQVDADAKGEVVYFPAGPSADYDGDGRIDLFLVNWFEGNHCRLLRNTSPAGNWLKVKVLGRKMNRMGVGAVVKVMDADGTLLGRREITTGYGYASGQVAEAHLGLGDRTSVNLMVEFPDGTDRTIKDVKANQLFEVTE